MSNLTDKLTSLAVEKNLLGGLYNNQDVLYEIDSFIKDTDFANKTHEILYNILRKSILEEKQVDKVLWAQKFKELNIGTRDEINNIFEYIDAITFTSLNKNGVINNAKELCKLRIRRDIFKDSQEVQNFITGPKCSEKTVSEIVTEVDSIYNKKINLITTDNEPIDLFAGIEEFLLEIAKNPVEEAGLRTPYEYFNRYFGGIRSGNLWNIISRFGEGKSVLLWNMAKGISLLNNVPVLYIDTEMSRKDNMLRMAAAESGINSWFLETGKWVHNPELVKKVQDSFVKLKKYNGRVHYIYAPNKNIKEIISNIRKFFFKFVGRGNKCLICYDYLKITSSLDKNRAEWQELGDCVSYLNEIGNTLDISILTAGQQNRTAETNGAKYGQRNDDSTTIAASDRIGQYSAFGAIFRKKTLDEITKYGSQFGSHILKPYKYSRTSGKDGYINNNLVKVMDGDKVKYEQNFINYNIHEYALEEKGTYKDIIAHQNLNLPLTNTNKSDKEDNTEL